MKNILQNMFSYTALTVGLCLWVVLAVNISQTTAMLSTVEHSQKVFSTECIDGIDNDNDGLVDMHDIDCTAISDRSE